MLMDAWTYSSNRNNNNNNNRPNDAFNAGPRPPLSVVDGPDRSQTGNTSPNNNVQRSGTMGRPAQTVKTGSSNRKRKRGNKVNQRKSSSTKDVNGRSNDQSDDANNKPAEPNAFFSDFANGRSSTDDFYSDDDDDDEDRQNRQRSFFLNNNNNNNNNGYDGSNDGPDPTRDERPRPSIPMPNSFRE
uniref:Uncharacterized protein n=1 Tax=Craspedostauros australis TaxID=1486917 RepID=A0A7R9WPG7_9STRA|mmetsp:Transcript_14658/g.40479  ORF Transcript_14658/g.40479 Transcript_14658/m.40479 type:complete len:186 (+) Transcript_14658:896-1453(+)